MYLIISIFIDLIETHAFNDYVCMNDCVCLIEVNWQKHLIIKMVNNNKNAMYVN